MGETIFSFRWGIDILDDGYTQIPNHFIRNYTQAGVKRHEFLLIVHLASYHYESADGECRPSISRLAEELGCTRQRIIQILDDLEARKLLVRHKRPGQTTIYDFSGFSRLMMDESISKANSTTSSKIDLTTPVKPILHEEENQQKERKTTAANAAPQGGDRPPRSKPNPPKEHRRPEPPTEKRSPAREMFGALAELCQIDWRVCTAEQRGALNQSEALLRRARASPADLGKTKQDFGTFAEYWYSRDWRGKRGDVPRPAQVREQWGAFCAWRKGSDYVPEPISMGKRPAAQGVGGAPG